MSAAPGTITVEGLVRAVLSVRPGARLLRTEEDAARFLIDLDTFRIAVDGTVEQATGRVLIATSAARAVQRDLLEVLAGFAMDDDLGEIRRTLRYDATSRRGWRVDAVEVAALEYAVTVTPPGGAPAAGRIALAAADDPLRPHLERLLDRLQRAAD